MFIDIPIYRIFTFAFFMVLLFGTFLYLPIGWNVRVKLAEVVLVSKQRSVVLGSRRLVDETKEQVCCCMCGFKIRVKMRQN
jgi:hypothetical protein